MNQVLIWIIVAAIVVGGGYFLLAGTSGGPEDAMMDGTMESGMMEGDAHKGEGAMMEKGAMMEDGTITEGEAMMMEKGGYEPYAASKLAMADAGDVVLFFRASWCPTCRALDSDIRANLSDIPAGLTILDVDYDAETALKQKYGVTYQHTFVQVASDGTQIKKWSGSSSLAGIVAEVQ